MVFIGYASILFIEKVLFKVREHGHTHDKKADECHTEKHEHTHSHHNQNEIKQNEIQVEEIVMEEGKEDHKDMDKSIEVVQRSSAKQYDPNEDTEKNVETENVIVKSKSSSDSSDFKEKAYTVLTPIALMIALCFHSIFAGLAVGLDTNSSNMWALIIAILLHKTGEGISLGICLANFYKFKNSCLLYTIVSIFG